MQSWPSALNSHHVRKQCGMALLEAIIAVAIFTIGVIGLMGLQGFAARASIEARNRTDAVMLSNQIIGDIWSQLGTGTALSAFEGTYDATHGTGAAWNWSSIVASQFPGGSGKATVTVAQATNEVTIAIQWVSPGEAWVVNGVPNSNIHNYTFQAQVTAQ